LAGVFFQGGGHGRLVQPRGSFFLPPRPRLADYPFFPRGQEEFFFFFQQGGVPPWKKSPFPFTRPWAFCYQRRNWSFFLSWEKKGSPCTKFFVRGPAPSLSFSTEHSPFGDAAQPFFFFSKTRVLQLGFSPWQKGLPFFFPPPWR